MADTFVANPGVGGDTFASDDIAGIHYPRSKLVHGADGVSDGDVSTANGLPTQLVNVRNTVSTANSTTANLAGAAVFTGTSENVSGFAQILVSVFASHASATDGLSLQQSSDGTNWDITDVFTIPATTGKTFSFQPAASFFRLVYTNGATLTTSLRIQTVYHYLPVKGSSQRPQDALSNENDFEQMSVFPHGFNGTTWDRLRSVNTGYLGVTPHYAGTAASTGVGASGAQTQRVVTATDSTIGTVTTVTTVTTLTGITNWGNVVDNGAFVDGTTRLLPAGYIFDETAGTALTENDAAAARVDAKRAQVLVVEDATTRGQRQSVNTSGGANVTPMPHTAGGVSNARIHAAASTNATNVKASAGQLYGWALFNTTAAIKYVKLYNSASAPTAGSGTPFLTIMLPAGSGTNVEFTMGVPMGTGIGYTIVTGAADTDATAVAANDVTGVLLYK
jgi:hypothetical protein